MSTYQNTAINDALAQNQHLKNILKRAQNDLYSKTKPIRVTDDDYSTIISNLGKLFGKINNFPPNCKSQLNKDANINHLFNAQDQHLLNSLPMDYALLAILVEKFIIETLVHHVFERGIHLNDAINNAYKSLSHLFLSAGHHEWATDLRLKSSRAVKESILADPDAILQEKERVVQVLVQGLSTLYPASAIQPRLAVIVDMATDLLLPIHGQETPIRIYTLAHNDRIIDRLVKHVYHPLYKDTIYLSVSPVFLAKSTLEADDDVLDTYIEGYSLIYPGKAIW